MPSLIATLGANIAPFLQELDAAKGHAQQKGGGISSALGQELTGKLGSMFALGAVEESIRRTAEYAERIKNLSIRTDVPVAELQKLDFIATKAGTDVMKMVKAIEAVAEAQAKGGKAGEALKTLGLSDAQIQNLGGARENFFAIARNLQDMPEEKTGEILRAFSDLGRSGRAFRELLPAIREGLDATADGFVPMADQDLERMAKLQSQFHSLASAMRAGTAMAVSGWMQLGEIIAGTAEKVLHGKFSEVFTGGVDRVLAEERRQAQEQADEKRRNALMDKTSKSLDDWKRTKDKYDPAADAARATNLDAENASLREKAEWSALTPLQKRARLENEIADLKDKQTHLIYQSDALHRAETENAILKKEAELDKIHEPKEGKIKDPFKGPKERELEINSLQRSGFLIGGLGNPLESASFETAKRSEKHLEVISRLAEGIKRAVETPQSPSPFGDTEF